MNVVIAALAAFALINGAAAAPPAECDLPQSFLSSENELMHVASEVRNHHRLNITVIGSGSSSLPGPDGAHFAYPARLEEALKQRLPTTDIKITAHVQSRQTTADMTAGLEKILADEKPSLVIWQAGTADALSGVEPEQFRSSLDDGLDAIDAASADAILVNMQYSPRTDSMLDVSSYADVMRWEAQQRGAVLFDRLAIMHYWSDAGTFDLYAATKDYDMARRVHACIGRALASQIINAAHLDAERVQTTR